MTSLLFYLILIPNGILFGLNAQIDIAGSFFANSGSGFILPNGMEYSATNPQAPPLLTVNATAPVGLILEGSEGIITNEAQLTAGNNLTLAGNQVINNGSLTAVNGTVNIIENNLNSSSNAPVGESLESQIANPRLQPDTSLGDENTEIEAIDNNNDRVIGGAQRGVNLFHSFDEFNIETGKGVYFANPDGVENILARVTGNNISEIRGTLGVEGIADLYFINPNGLFFNQNASLDLNGSFFASTAEAIVFDEFEYRAVNPNLPPNLVVSVPTGLRFGENPGDIILKNEEPLNIVQEQGDTGELLDTAQSVNDSNTSVPDGIQGDLTGGNDADLYQVSLEAGKPFSATTVGRSDVNTRLFLFNSQGLGIDANEDSPAIILQSTLSEFTPTESGVYYLGISSFANAPKSIDGEIFAFNSNTFEFEGLGVGGNSPLSSWNQSGFGDGGGYVISLSNTSTNLAVNSGQTLALIGGNVTIDRIKTISPGSKIILAGLNQGGIVNINPDLSLSFPQGINRADVSLINSTVLDVAGNDGGSINLNAQNLDINDSQVLAGIGEGNGFENAQAGDITLDIAETLEVENSFLFNEVNRDALGNSGRILVNAQDVIINDSAIATDIVSRGNIEGIVIDTATLFLTNGGQIAAATDGEGNAGRVRVTASEGITLDGETSDGIASRILSVVTRNAVGNSGGIVIDTTKLSLTNGGLISTTSFGEGDAGALQIKANEGITLDGEASNAFPSGIFSRVELGAVGNSEGIVIDTTKLSLTNGGAISASTFGEGDAGAIQIKANKGITLDGETSNAFPSGIFSQVNPDAVGNSGGIVIDTTILSLTNGGTISASTFAKGNTGAIQITATEGITLDGEDSDGFPSGIFSQVNPDAVGNSGGIVIDTTILSLTNGGTISASTFAKGNTGAIQITATEGITLDGEDSDGFPSRIVSRVAPDAGGDGGNINLTVKEFLTLRNGSEISTTAGNKKTGGDGGNINIFARYIFAIPEENSDIKANAFSGKGGQIFIATEAIFGIEPRDEQSPLSDITASSELGVDGIIEITRLNVDPLEGLTNLPETRADIEVAQGCDVGGEGSISFYDLGKGGLPTRPGDYLTIDSIIIPWIRLTNEVNPQSWNLENHKSVKISDSNTQIIFTFSCYNH